MITRILKTGFSTKIFYLLIVFIVPSGHSCKNQGDPVMFKVDAQHSGIYNTVPLRKFNGVKWKYATNGRIFSSAVIAGDYLYEGSNDSCLYAIHKGTGSLVWKCKTGGKVASTPAISNGVIYFTSFDGKLYALDALTGAQVWVFNGGAEKNFTAPGIHGLHPRDSVMTDTWDVYQSSPVVSENKVFFGSGEGNFYCINISDGHLLWKFSTAGVIHDAPAADEKKVYFGGWDTYLHALDINTGEEVWKFKTGTDTVYYNQTGIQSSPVIHNGYVYFGCRDAHLYALNAETGELAWKKFNNFSWINNTPVVKDSLIYYGTSDTHKLIGLNAYTGDSVTAFNLSAYIFSSPVIADDMLYIGDFSGTIYGIDLSAMRIELKFRTPGSMRNEFGLLKTNGEMDNETAGNFFRSGPTYDNNLSFMDALYSLGAILATPVVDEGTLYIGSTDGYIYAVN